MNHVPRFQQEIRALKQAAWVHQLGGTVTSDDDGPGIVPGRVNRLDDRLCEGQIRMPKNPLLLHRPLKKHLCSLRLAGLLAFAIARLIGRLRLFPSLILANAPGEEQEENDRKPKSESRKQPSDRNPCAD